MTPTDELCAKLDERGIAYETPSTTCTEAYINGIEYTFYEYVEPLDDSLEGKVFATTEWLTPEQAIAATVGAGTLTAEQVRECVKGVYFEGYSDGATLRVNGIEETDWQAIADKLNATLGAGTCRNKGFVDDGGWYFVCSECGCEFEYGDFACEFAEGHGLGSPKFCPNCGARVVVE